MSGNFYSTSAAGSRQPKFRDCPNESNRGMAEREGFEPPIPVKVCLLSRQVPSTTRPSLRATSAYILILSGTLFASSRHAHLNGLSPTQRPRPSPGCDWLLHFTIWISSGPTVWVRIIVEGYWLMFRFDLT